jgi:hypothetical protein
MATHHSTSGRTKSSAPKIVVPSWDSMWESFDNHNQKTTVEAMNAEGWRTIDQVTQKTGLSSPRIYNMVREGKFETVKKKVFYGGKTRDIKFVRPRI